VRHACAGKRVERGALAVDRPHPHWAHRREDACVEDDERRFAACQPLGDALSGVSGSLDIGLERSDEKHACGAVESGGEALGLEKIADHDLGCPGVPRRVHIPLRSDHRARGQPLAPERREHGPTLRT